MIGNFEDENSKNPVDVLKDQNSYLLLAFLLLLIYRSDELLLVNREDKNR